MEQEYSENKLIVDVETANDVDCPFTYDVSACITNPNNHSIVEKAFVIRDVFVYEQEMMKSAYYAEKITQYIDDLRANNREMANFLYMRNELLRLMSEYNCNTVAAYNCHFDRNALNNTLRYITKSRMRWFFPYDTNFICIWSMACQTICQSEEYKKFAESHNLLSNNGRNYRTTAENVYAFLTNNPEFCEEHKGLEDVRIENYIMNYCFEHYDVFEKGLGINRGCWQWVKRNLIQG